MIRFADGLSGARQLAVAPNGDVFVIDNGQIVVLLDTNGDGVSDAGERTVFASYTGRQPRPRDHANARLRVVEHDGLPLALRLRRSHRDQRDGDRRLEHPTGGHSSRTVIVDAQNRLYVSIGSASNVDVPPDGNTPPPCGR